MFTTKILEKIFAQKEIQRISLEHQSIMIHAIEKVLEEEEINALQLQYSEQE